MKRAEMPPETSPETLGPLRREEKTKSMTRITRPLFAALIVFMACASPSYPATKPLEEVKRLENRAVRLLQAGQPATALPLLRRSLAIIKKNLGPGHLRFAQILNNVAMIHQSLKQYKKARPLFDRSLRIRIEALGPEHPSVAVALNNLGGFHQALGQLKTAGKLFRRALAIREKALAPGTSKRGSA